jgi:hypothetical protein
MTVWLASRFARSWVLALLTGVGAAMLAHYGARIVPGPQALEELAYYPSGRHLEIATLGHGETAADLAWMRAVQYYGEHRLTGNHFERMEHVFDILTTLSPGFIPAYIFGGFALAQEGQNFPAAERLMLKGIEANPKNGWLAFEMGFLYYVRPGGRNLLRAAEYFELASFQPDAPSQASRFAAYARQNAGDLAVSYALWEEVLSSTRNFYLREVAQREMERIGKAIAEGRKQLAMKRLGTPLVKLDSP